MTLAVEMQGAVRLPVYAPSQRLMLQHLWIGLLSCWRFPLAGAQQPGHESCDWEDGPSMLQAARERTLRLRQPETGGLLEPDPSPSHRLVPHGNATGPAASLLSESAGANATWESLSAALAREKDGFFVPSGAGLASAVSTENPGFVLHQDQIAIANVLMIACLGSAALAIGADDGLPATEHAAARDSLFGALAAASISGVAGPFTGDKVANAHGALFTVNLLLGIRGVVLKLSLYEANPLVVTSMLLFSAAAVITSTAIAKRVPLVMPSEDTVTIIFGGVMLALSQLSFAVGLKLQDASTAMYCQPGAAIFTSAFAIICGYERTTALKAISFILAVFAVLTMVILDPDYTTDFVTGFARMCLLVGCYTLSLYIVVVKGLVGRHASMMVAAWTTTIAAVVAINVTALITFQPDPLSLHCWSKDQSAMDSCMNHPFALQRIPPLLLLFLVACAVATPVLLCYATQYVKPSVAGIYCISQPIVTAAATILCFLALGEWSQHGGVPLPDFGPVLVCMHSGAVLAFVLVQEASAV